MSWPGRHFILFDPFYTVEVSVGAQPYMHPLCVGLMHMHPIRPKARFRCGLLDEDHTGEKKTIN